MDIYESKKLLVYPSFLPTSWMKADIYSCKYTKTVRLLQGPPKWVNQLTLRSRVPYLTESKGINRDIIKTTSKASNRCSGDNFNF